MFIRSCPILVHRRAQKTECGPYTELVKLVGQDKGAAELAAFAASKQAEFEAVSRAQEYGAVGLWGSASGSQCFCAASIKACVPVSSLHA